MPLPVQQQSTEPVRLGDIGFLGVNMRLHPSIVQPGYVSEAQNCRFRDGIIETRKGTIKPVWCQKRHLSATITHVGTTATVTTEVAHSFPDGQNVLIMGASPTDYNGVFGITVGSVANQFTYTTATTPATDATGNIGVYTDAAYRWGTIHGTGWWSDPNSGYDYFLIAADGAVYATTQYQAPERLSLPSDITLTGSIQMVQAFDRMILFRGFDLEPLEMTVLTEGFKRIVQYGEGTGTEPIPNSTHGIFVQNRLWIPDENDGIAYSDVGDPTHYLPVASELRINQGSSDSIVGLTKFNDATIIVAKEHRIAAVLNIYGTLDAAYQDEITDTHGVVGRKTMAKPGKDLWYLSELGVMSITQTEQNKLQGVVQPVSEPMQPIIDRINWRVARTSACAAYWDNKYMLAVPLDDANMQSFNRLPNVATAGTSVTIEVTAGKWYRAEFGTNDVSVVNGSKTYTKGTGSGEYQTTIDFAAESTTVTWNKTADLAPGGSLKELFREVNTHILVYDFLNQAWSGYDCGDGLMPADLVVFRVDGRDHLLVVNADGSILDYEQAYDDELIHPYMDVTLTAAPVTGDVFRFSKAKPITVNTASANTATTMGNNVTLANAQRNLWADTEATTSGFYLGAGNVWESLATIPVKISGGVRFYAMDGRLPPFSVTLANPSNNYWSYESYNRQQITSFFVTRGYNAPEGYTLDPLFAIAHLQTWNPSYTISTVTPGVEEETAVSSDVTKSRTAYYRPYNKAAWVSTNANDDFLTPYREDYSVQVSATAGIQLRSGIKLDLHQSTQHKIRLGAAHDEYTQVKITNAQGRMRVPKIILETTGRRLPAGERA